MDQRARGVRRLAGGLVSGQERELAQAQAWGPQGGGQRPELDRVGAALTEVSVDRAEKETAADGSHSPPQPIPVPPGARTHTMSATMPSCSPGPAARGRVGSTILTLV